MIEVDDTGHHNCAIRQGEFFGIALSKHLISHARLSIHSDFSPRAIVQLHLREFGKGVNPAICGNLATGASRGLLHGGNDFLLVSDRPLHAVKLSRKLRKYILIHVKISFSIFKMSGIIRLSFYACRGWDCTPVCGFSFSA